MMDKLQTYILVTLIAMLIWLYAEGENTKVYTNERVRINFTAGGGENLVIDPSSIAVNADIQCSASQRAAMQLLLSKGPIDIPLSYDPTKAMQNVNVGALLEKEALARLGVNIVKTDPSIQPVRVEAIEILEVDILVVRGAHELLGEPRVEPSKVQVHVPAREKALWKDVRLEAHLDSIDPVALEANQVPARDEQQFDIKLTLPKKVRNSNALLNPAAVKVSFMLKSRTKTIKLDRVRINVTAASTTLEQYAVSLNEDNRFLLDVELTGPAEAIDRINTAQQAGKLSELVRADLLLLNASEIKEGQFQASPELKLPPNVSPASQIKLIDYTIKKRTPAPGSPPGSTAPGTNGAATNP